MLDCGACKTQQSMSADSVPRFSGVVRVIGWILLMPSILGMAAALTMFLFTANDPGERGAGVAMGVFTMFGIMSLVSGLLGWILLMRKNVYKCGRCGFILDRA